MSPSTEKPKKSRWGCLALLLIPTVLFAAGLLHDRWVEKQPLSYHLRNVFKESGFEVPDYVYDLSGSKGFVDFQGDYSAFVSFSIRPSDVGHFMKLPAKLWKNPAGFQSIKNDDYFGGDKVPVGAFIIEEWSSPPSEYHCKYAVDTNANRIYFYRESW